MVDIFPRRNLPPLAEPWGREVEKRSNDHELQIESLGQGLSGQNRNTASSLAVIAQQIEDIQTTQADLSGRVSYSTSSSESQSWTSTQPNNQPWGPTLSFTLNEARVVSLQFTLAGTVVVTTSSGTATSGYAHLRPMLFLNGGSVGPTQPWLHADLYGAGTSLTAPVEARALVDLPAGDHTLQGGFARRQLITNQGVPLFGIVGADNPGLIVDVLQTN